MLAIEREVPGNKDPSTKLKLHLKNLVFHSKINYMAN